jgi:fucose permease
MCQVVTYAVQAAAPPFPVFCIFFVLNGFGLSIQDAQANGLVASLHEHAEEKMGVLHAIYGENQTCFKLFVNLYVRRVWSTVLSVGFYAVCTATSMVISLSRITRGCFGEYYRAGVNYTRPFFGRYAISFLGPQG